MSESNSSVDSTTSEYMGGVEEVLFVDAKRGQGTHAITRAVYKAGRHVNERRNRRGLNDRPLWVGIIGAVKRGVCMARGQDGIINLHNRSLFSRTVSLFLHNKTLAHHPCIIIVTATVSVATVACVPNQISLYSYLSN